MGKHRQTKSLGTLGNFVSTETPGETPPETPESQRIAALEKRVSTLEILLNDVMRELDQPTNSPKKPNATGTPNAKQPKNKQQGTAKPPKAKQPKQQVKAKQPKGYPEGIKEIDREAYDALKKLLSDGEKRTETQIYDALESLGKKPFRRLRHHFSNDGNKDRHERLYFL